MLLAMVYEDMIINISICHFISCNMSYAGGLAAGHAIRLLTEKLSTHANCYKSKGGCYDEVASQNTSQPHSPNALSNLCTLPTC